MTYESDPKSVGTALNPKDQYTPVTPSTLVYKVKRQSGTTNQSDPLTGLLMAEALLPVSQCSAAGALKRK